MPAQPIFPVKMPSGVRYWTVVDDDFQVVPIVDQWLRHLLFGRSRAELTTYAYAISAALYLRWCLKTGRDWRLAARDLGLFVVWLRHPKSTDGDTLLMGPGAKPARGDRRINKVLSAVRGLLTFAVSVGEAPSTVLGQIYEIADGRDLPEELQGENGLAMRIGVQHRLQEPETEVDRATDAEVVALFKACRNARDRLIVLLLARVGLRRGQAAGLHRCDCHLLVDSRALRLRRRWPSHPRGPPAEPQPGMVEVAEVVVSAYELNCRPRGQVGSGRGGLRFRDVSPRDRSGAAGRGR